MWRSGSVPVDERFRDLIVATFEHLTGCGFGVVYGYTQSDKISLLSHPREETFERKHRRYNSVLAGEASAKFSLLLGAVAVFDCRSCELPTSAGVRNYFRGAPRIPTATGSVVVDWAPGYLSRPCGSRSGDSPAIKGRLVAGAPSSGQELLRALGRRLTRLAGSAATAHRFQQLGESEGLSQETSRADLPRAFGPFVRRGEDHDRHWRRGPSPVKARELPAIEHRHLEVEQNQARLVCHARQQLERGRAVRRGVHVISLVLKR